VLLSDKKEKSRSTTNFSVNVSALSSVMVYDCCSFAVITVQGEADEHRLMQNHGVRSSSAFWAEDESSVVDFDVHIMLQL
jgi:hypothetical protein